MYLPFIRENLPHPFNLCSISANLDDCCTIRTEALDMNPSELNANIQFVVGAEGKPTAVIVDIHTWERILETLEDASDVTLAREMLASIEAAGGDLERAGFVPWLK
jgi:hypothetical protein